MRYANHLVNSHFRASARVLSEQEAGFVLHAERSSRGVHQETDNVGSNVISPLVSDVLLAWGASGPGHPSDRRLIRPMEDHGQGRFRGIYVQLVTLAVAVACGHRRP